MISSKMHNYQRKVVQVNELECLVSLKYMLVEKDLHLAQTGETKLYFNIITDCKGIWRCRYLCVFSRMQW